MSLRARNVTVRFGDFVALDDVDLELGAGEVVGVIGPNGAGKSTLVAVLAGERAPDDGDVSLGDRTLAEWRLRDLARRRAVVLQSASLSFPFTVREVVELGRLPHRAGAPGPDDRAIAHDALRLVGLETMAERRYTTLSGGEQQRVHLARALAQLGRVPELKPDGVEEASLEATPADGPSSVDDDAQHGRGGAESSTGADARFLLLDEPTSSLDLAHIGTVVQLVRRLAGLGTGVLVVLHDLNLAATLADRLVLLCEGRVVARGAPGEVLTRDHLRSAYDIEVDFVTGPDGARVLLPKYDTGARDD